MGNFADDILQGLLEAIEIKKGNIPIRERNNMPAPTYYVSNKDDMFINKTNDCEKESS